VPKTIAKNLEKAGIGIVSELLDADMDELSSIKGIDEDSLDEIYTAVQSFVEREIELEEVVDEGVDISSFIDENNKDINSTTNEDEDDSTEDDITPSEELADSTHEEETIAKDTK
jgi:predicted RecB family nuclease